MYGGEQYHLYNIYGPNGDNKGFFQNLGTKIQNINPKALILARDLNTILSPVEYRKLGGISNLLSQVFLTFLNITGLRDG